MQRDLGIITRVEILIDSSAAVGVISRSGLGKLRHIEVQDLWLQEAVKAGRLAIFKIKGEHNDSDLGTNPLGRRAIQVILRRLGMRDVVTASGSQ